MAFNILKMLSTANNSLVAYQLMFWFEIASLKSRAKNGGSLLVFI